MSKDGRNTDNAKTFAFLLYVLRQRAGLSRHKLAKKARLSEATIKILEAGKHLPSNRILYSLMRVPELELVPFVLREVLIERNLMDFEMNVEMPNPETGGKPTKELTVKLTIHLKPKW